MRLSSSPIPLSRIARHQRPCPSGWPSSIALRMRLTTSAARSAGSPCVSSAASRTLSYPSRSGMSVPWIVVTLEAHANHSATRLDAGVERVLQQLTNDTRWLQVVHRGHRLRVKTLISPGGTEYEGRFGPFHPCDSPAAAAKNARDSSSAASRTSGSVVGLPRLTRTPPSALGRSSPIAVSTCDGVPLPDEQADPAEIASWPRHCAMMASASTPSRRRLRLPGTRWRSWPQTCKSGTCRRRVASRRLPRHRRCSESVSSRAWARRRASPIPTASGTGTVPGRTPRCCPPPASVGRISRSERPERRGRRFHRAVNLVSGKAQQVHAECVHVDGNPTDALRRVRVQERAGPAADLTDVANWLQDPDLIVGQHDGDDEGLVVYGPQRVPQRLRDHPDQPGRLRRGVPRSQGHGRCPTRQRVRSQRKPASPGPGRSGSGSHASARLQDSVAPETKMISSSSAFNATAA